MCEISKIRCAELVFLKSYHHLPHCSFQIIHYCRAIISRRMHNALRDFTPPLTMSKLLLDVKILTLQKILPGRQLHLCFPLLHQFRQKGLTVWCPKLLSILKKTRSGRERPPSRYNAWVGTQDAHNPLMAKKRPKHGPS
jgi:hypothetical protein